MMRQAVVQRLQWLTDQEFLDLLGATNLIPGPNSTELAIHVGYRRARWPGLVVAGIAFIGPATLIVLALAWAYVRYGSTPQGDAILYGVRPIIIAVIVQALWLLGRTAFKGTLTGAVGLLTLLLLLAGANPLLVLVAGGVAVMAVENLSPIRARGMLPFVFLASRVQGITWLVALSSGTALVPFSLLRLFGLMLKIGSVLYGSGYVLLAFLRADFVQHLHWLSDRQLLDAVTVGQFTPGPVLTTATFIGYVLGGVPGALVATVGIFLPGFLLVAASQPVLLRLRRSSWASGFLDGVNVASLALMVPVTWQLGRQALIDPLTVALALVSTGLLTVGKVNSLWLILAAVAIGLFLR